MELTAIQQQQRERIVGLILSAKTLAEISEAKQILQEWMAAHPDDLGLTDGFDHLAMSRSLAERSETAQQAA